MSTGATDNLYLRNAGISMYGTSGGGDINDSHAHGKEERIGMKAFYDGQEFLYRSAKAMSQPNERGTAKN